MPIFYSSIKIALTKYPIPLKVTQLYSKHQIVNSPNLAIAERSRLRSIAQSGLQRFADRHDQHLQMICDYRRVANDVEGCQAWR